MDTVTYIFLLQELDMARADLHTLLHGILFGHGSHLLNEIIGYKNTRHKLVHVLGHSYAGQYHQPRHYLYILTLRDSTGIVHEPFKVVHVIYGLGLEELRSGLHLPVSYTHLRAHETKANLVCRLLLEKK